ncbi:uncharacterized protein LOC120627647 [Pararge aegeria]|uniref:uncharacterized protein LOC120627647 n=1 Tax=Pararge aegeria TaxID=116150 RepID=UPI0019D01168|nr:uncharacterized protein LOC120627647 [Pararge aegeria]
MYCLSWDSYKNYICNGFAQLQQREELVDMTLVAEGHLVKVHKNLISLASPYIKNVINLVPCTHPIIFLSSITHEVLCQLLEYIYTGEVHVELEKLNAFIKAAKEFQLPGIAYDLLKETSLTNGQNNNTPEAIPTGKNINIINRQLEYRSSNSAVDSNINDILDSHTAQNVNKNHEWPQKHLINRHMKNDTKALPVNKIQILENREILLGTSDAPIEIKTNDINLDIDMKSLESANNNNQNMSHATILINGQSTNTMEELSTGNGIQLIKNSLLDYGTTEGDIELNNMDNILVTNMQSLDTDLQKDGNNHYDSSNSVTVTETYDANNFDDFLKFPEPQNSTAKRNSVSQNDQNYENNKPANSEAPFEYSLDLSTSVIPQQYTVSNRGSVQMILNRYMYSVQYSANSGVKRRWRCIDYRILHCKAFVDTLDGKIIKRKNCHTHPFHDSKIMKKLKANLVFGAFSTAMHEMKKRNNMDSVVQAIDSE